jgi:hypothetical protein
MFLFNQQLIELQSTLSGDLSKDERIEELKQIAIDTVDINGIGLIFSRLAQKKCK